MTSRALGICLNVLLAIVLTGTLLHAQEMPVPISVQFPLLMKVLSFDRNLKHRVGGEIVIGIIYQSNFRTSFNVKDEILRTIGESSVTHVDGIPIRCVPINIDEETDLAEGITRYKLNILYVTPLRAVDMETITAVSLTKHVPTITGVPEYVESGLSIGVGTKGGKPLIVINLTAAKAAGIDLNSQLLNLAKVIK